MRGDQRHRVLSQRLAHPYLYDGRDGARYDVETGLYWLAVRAYDPTLGRFLSRDPLGRAPLVGWSRDLSHLSQVR